MNDVQDLNNQVILENRTRARYCKAIKEAFGVQKRNKNSIVIDVGFIFCTHGFVFEFTKNGWTLRPNNYLHPAEVMKRYPLGSQRARFYRMRHAQKNYLNRL